MGYYAYSCGGRNDRIDLLEDSIKGWEAKHDTAVSVADSAIAISDSLHIEVEKNKTEHEIVVREVTKDISRQLADAHGAEDTMRVALTELQPDLLPTLDRLVGAYEGVVTNKDRIIGSGVFRIALLEVSENKAIDATGKAVDRAVTAEKGWATEKALTKELKKGDINIFGLHIDFTCGVTAMVGLVTPGEPGAAVGVGCTIGK